MGFLHWVPVKLKQRPWLVSMAAVIALIVNAGTDSLVTGGGRLEGCFARRMAVEAEVQVDWKQRRLMPLASRWTMVLTISSCCHFHLDAVLTLLVITVFSLCRQM